MKYDGREGGIQLSSARLFVLLQMLLYKDVYFLAEGGLPLALVDHVHRLLSGYPTTT